MATILPVRYYESQDEIPQPFSIITGANLRRDDETRSIGHDDEPAADSARGA